MARGSIITITACALLVACGEGEVSPMDQGILSVGAPAESAGVDAGADDDDDDDYPSGDDDDDYPSGDDGDDYPPDGDDYPPADDGDDHEDAGRDTEGDDDEGGSETDGGHDEGGHDEAGHDEGGHDEGDDPETTGASSPDDWSGDFDGDFDGDSYSELYLQLDCADNVLTGTALDDFGSSIVEGVCDDDAVSFEKIYVDGDYIGSSNDYVGIRIAGHLEGTWSNDSLDGTWEADEA